MVVANDLGGVTEALVPLTVTRKSVAEIALLRFRGTADLHPAEAAVAYE